MGGGSQRRAPSTLGVTSEETEPPLRAAPHKAVKISQWCLDTYFFPIMQGLALEGQNTQIIENILSFAGLTFCVMGTEGGGSEETGVPGVGCGIKVRLRKGSEPSTKFCRLKDLPQSHLQGSRKSFI